jgi:spore maturation protein CgeB
VLATGLVPLNADALSALGQMGVRRLNYLTDDPWNPTLRSGWSLQALRQYDHVFTVRRANQADLVQHGCRNVTYVPFGFDRDLFFPESADHSDACQLAADVLFVGGADRERVPYVAALRQLGISVAVYGDYWSRYPETRAMHRGYGDIISLRKATSAANVNLCLVRRANRDGQVMRSYEAAAIGACMLVEDTPEHRELFGADGEAVVYFQTIDDMLGRLRQLLKTPDERARLRRAVLRRMQAGQHTYDDRLQRMLRVAA